jgi:hypothetical protein
MEIKKREKPLRASPSEAKELLLFLFGRLLFGSGFLGFSFFLNCHGVSPPLEARAKRGAVNEC